MYERILVPTDGSATANASMPVVIDLARTFGAEVHVLHVVDSWHYDTSIESAVAPLREEGEAYVQRLVEEGTDAGVTVTGAVEIGRPARTILEYADEHGVDLVVMGTRGRGGFPTACSGASRTTSSPTQTFRSTSCRPSTRTSSMRRKGRVERVEGDE